MDLFMKIGSALLLGMMLVMIFPRARQMIKNSPKGSGGDWMGVLVPIGLVALFVMLLISIV